MVIVATRTSLVIPQAGPDSVATAAVGTWIWQPTIVPIPTHVFTSVTFNWAIETSWQFTFENQDDEMSRQVWFGLWDQYPSSIECKAGLALRTVDNDHIFLDHLTTTPPINKIRSRFDGVVDFRGPSGYTSTRISHIDSGSTAIEDPETLELIPGTPLCNIEFCRKSQWAFNSDSSSGTFGIAIRVGATITIVFEE